MHINALLKAAVYHILVFIHLIKPLNQNPTALFALVVWLHNEIVRANVTGHYHHHQLISGSYAYISLLAIL